MAVAPSDIRFRRSMTQRSEDLLKQITLFLQTHPTEAASLGLPLPPQTLPVPLAPSEQPAEQPAPQKRHVRSARVYWRRSFYAAVVMGLAFLAFNVTQLMYLEHKSRNAQELVVEEVRQNRGWLGRVVVVQAVIITFNVILTWRGVKVGCAPPHSGALSSRAVFLPHAHAPSLAHRLHGPCIIRCGWCCDASSLASCCAGSNTTSCLFAGRFASCGKWDTFSAGRWHPSACPYGRSVRRRPRGLRFKRRRRQNVQQR